MTKVNPTKKKAELSRKLFAQLSKRQAGHEYSIVDKVLNNIHTGLDSIEVDERKLATTTFLKLFEHIMPKESSPLVSINNNKLDFNGKSADDVLMKLGEFMADRQSKIEAIEDREQNRELEIVAPPKKSPKLPANSPLSPNDSE